MRTYAEIAALVALYPVAHRRWCPVVGACGCMGCLTAPGPLCAAGLPLSARLTEEEAAYFLANDKETD